MSRDKCPSEQELISFVDADAPPEQLSRVERHLELCGACAKHVMSLTELVRDIGAPVEQSPLGMAEHVAGVMRRLDTPVVERRWSRWLAWGGGAAVAAASVLTMMQRAAPGDAPVTGLVARGGAEEASLSRHVGVQLYAQRPTLTALSSGERITRSTPLTAGLRNLGPEAAHLLLFAVDSRQAVHWIAPEYRTEGENPQAAPVRPGASERLLPSAAVFDDLATGPLRVYAVISRAPLHVGDVEALAPSELSAERLLVRLPHSEVRQFLLEVE